MRGYIPLSMVLTCRARRDPHRSILAGPAPILAASRRGHRWRSIFDGRLDDRADQRLEAARHARLDGVDPQSSPRSTPFDPRRARTDPRGVSAGTSVVIRPRQAARRSG